MSDIEGNKGASSCTEEVQAERGGFNPRCKR